MFDLSKSNFLHSLLNRKYNLIIKFIFSVLGWTISFLLMFNLRISNFIFIKILLGNDLKNEIGLAERGFLGNQPSEPSVGRRLDDLLSDLE